MILFYLITNCNGIITKQLKKYLKKRNLLFQTDRQSPLKCRNIIIEEKRMPSPKPLKKYLNFIFILLGTNQ